MTTEKSTTYDAVPYESHPYLHSHPCWLESIARLFGMMAPAPESARILELGCASGGNLVPMAESLPGSSCLGIDLSSRQIKDGQAFVEATQLRNVELKQASILDVDESYGQFDYIICHGVYSWVDRNVQQQILKLCENRLSPSGIAYISYNTYPGWHMLGMLRDMMRFHASRFKEPAKQIAQSRALLEVLAKTITNQNNPYGMLLKRESEKLRHSSDWYIYHEQLEENNDPVYFHEFVERAGAAGLQFLGESELRGMLANQFSPEIQAVLSEVATTLIFAEQYMDFFRNRTFRKTLLCQQGILLNRKLDVESVKPFKFASALIPQSEICDLSQNVAVKFEAPDWPSTTLTDTFGKVTLLCLREAWPESVSLSDLETAVRTRLSLPPATETTDFGDLMWSWFIKGIANMTHTLPNCVKSPGERPQGSVVAQAQLKLGVPKLTNLLHRTVKIAPFEATVLALLDGTLDRPAIAERVTQLQKQTQGVGETLANNEQDMQRRVNTALTALAEAALLRN